MRHTFLIARQEFIKYITRRGFFISILMFPVWIAIVILIPQWTGSIPQRTFTIVDRAGGYREAILDALEREDAARGLKALAAYAQSNVDSERLRQQAPLLADILASPDDARSLRALHSLGGSSRLLQKLAPFLKSGARIYRSPMPRFVYVQPPARLTHTRQFPATVRPYLESGQFYAAVLIPKDFGASARYTAQYFSTDLAESDLQTFVIDSLSAALRHNILARNAPALADGDALNVSANLEWSNPATKGATGRPRSYDLLVPIALAVILFVVSVMNVSVLLQGVVEEKSSRMIEVLLSCATPREITSGKLVGVILVALVTVTIWALALFALMAMADAGTVSLVFDALRSVATLNTLPLLLLFFFCGLLIYGSLFLAIGSVATSLADAQSLIGPAMLILMLPNLMITGIMHDPNGEFASIVSWVPFYTPFFMMLRIASHPPALQLWGTAVLALATTSFMIWWTGRIFANHVLTTERPPTWAGLVKRGVELVTGRAR